MGNNFKVIIVGGSIAGLSLAHCLERAGIDYIILERHKDIAAHVGASVGIFPNGARILDQLGLFDAIESEIQILDSARMNFPDGFSFISKFPTVLYEQSGYPIATLERYKFLAILYSRLSDKTKVNVNKSVDKIDLLPSGVRVYTSDGMRYDGDLVVGADGVRSKVRSEMWRFADEKRPALVPQIEKNSTTVEYACVYGTSSAVPGLPPREQVICFYDGLTIFTFYGKYGEIFWFVVQKCAKKYLWPDVPRFTRTHAEELCESMQNVKLAEGVDFSHVWAQRLAYEMTALEENVFDHWYFGRIVCLGDSVHKMTPNYGQGANCAIESAAVLANALCETIHVRRIQKPSELQIDELLEYFAKRRIERTKAIAQTSSSVTRLQARQGVINRILGRYIIPYLPDQIPPSYARVLMGEAEKLNFLPVPKRAFANGWPRLIGEGGKDGTWRARAWSGLHISAEAAGLICLAAGSVCVFGVQNGLISIKDFTRQSE